jgi:hypothetical protein
MKRAWSGRGSGAQDGTGDGGRAPEEVREAELPVRDGRRAPVHRAQLLRRQPDQVFDVAASGGGGGPAGDGALQGGQGASGGTGQRGAGRAGHARRSAQEDELSTGPAPAGKARPGGAFAAPAAQFD